MGCRSLETRATFRSPTRRLILAATAALLTLFATALPAADVSKWVPQLTASDRAIRREASYQLLQLGAGAKAALPDLIKALDDSDKQVWSNAIATIAAIGPEAVDAVPKLLEGLDSRSSRGQRPRDRGQTLFRSAYALARIGEAAKPQLIAALKGPDTGLRIGAAKALGGMGPSAKEAIPALIENLGHDDQEVRSEVIESLGLIGAEAVAPLRDALGLTDPRLREGSARALAAIGEAAAPAGDKLLESAAKEKDPEARSAVLSALPKVGLPPAQVLPPLIAALKSDDEALRHAATNAILLVHPAAKTAVPAVAALLADPAQAERAAYVLGRFGEDAHSAIPALLALILKSETPAAAYTDALAQIGEPSVPVLLAQLEKITPSALTRDHWALKTLKAIGSVALPELRKALDSSSVTVRIAALAALADLGPEAREARNDVLKLGNDPDPMVRAMLLTAVVALDSSTSRALKKIEASTHDANALVRAASATAAAALGRDAAPVAAQVAALLDDPDSNVRLAAIRAAAAIGVKDPTIIERITTRLDDPSARVAAIEALARLGAGGAADRLIALYPLSDSPTKIAILSALSGAGDPALPTIQLALKDRDPAIRAAGVRALATAQHNLDLLIPALQAALGDRDAFVRRASMDAVATLGDKNSSRLLEVLKTIIGLGALDADRIAALETLRAFRIKDLDLIGFALDSPSAEVRAWACERAGRLAANARPLRPKLEALLNSSIDYDRRGARRALEAIGR